MISIILGYFFFILGLYLVDFKNSDVVIFNYVIVKSVDIIWVKEEDVMVEGFGIYLKFWRI